MKSGPVEVEVDVEVVVVEVVELRGELTREEAGQTERTRRTRLHSGFAGSNEPAPVQPDYQLPWFGSRATRSPRPVDFELRQQPCPIAR